MKMIYKNFVREKRKNSNYINTNYANFNKHKPYNKVLIIKY